MSEGVIKVTHIHTRAHTYTHTRARCENVFEFEQAHLKRFFPFWYTVGNELLVASLEQEPT